MISNNDLLKCTSSLGCGETKSKDNFRKNPHRPSYFNICKQCEQKNKKIYRENNKILTEDERFNYRVKQTQKLKNSLQKNSLLHNFEFLKKCTNINCCTIDNLYNFSIAKMNPDGYQDKCRTCQQKDYLLRKKFLPTLEIKEKLCSSCNINKNISNFNKSFFEKDGYCKYCKICNNKNFKNRSLHEVREIQIKRSNNLIKRYNLSLPLNIIVKKCLECTEPKNIDCFRKDRSSFDGLSNLCKEHLSVNSSNFFTGFKLKTNYEVNEAVRNKKIIKPLFCSSCKKEQNKLEGHHDDYTKSLDVRWLCRKCHSDWHYNNYFYEILLLPNDDIIKFIKFIKIDYKYYFVINYTDTFQHVIVVLDRLNKDKIKYLGN